MPDAAQVKHVRYHVILAFIEPINRRLVTQEQKGNIVKVLNCFKRIENRPLQRLVTQVEPLLTTPAA